MKFIDYIFGSRRGQDANEVEKQSMTDPFLADAMEGVDDVYDNHHDILNDLRQKVSARAEKKTRPAFVRRRMYMLAGIAASVLVVVSALFITMSRRGAVENDGIAANFASDSAESSEGLVSSGVTAMSVDGNFSDAAVAVSEVDVVDSSVLAMAAHDVISTGDASVNNMAAAVKATTQTVDASADVNNNGMDAAVNTDAVLLRSRSMAIATEESAAAGDLQAEFVAESVSAAVEDNTANNIRVVRNERFEEYFAANSRALRSAGGGQSGSFVVEFRVNDAGIPTSVRVVSGVSQDVNRKVIELLVSGPVWEPTSGERVRTVLKY